MKQGYILPDDTRISTPDENETVRILREALRRLGPNGENWFQGDRCNKAEDKFCAFGAISVAAHGSPRGITANALLPRDALRKAADSLSHRAPASLNDLAESFAEVRTMFERAIELASAPQGAPQ